MSGQHAFLPPSGAGAWVVCNLWPTMNQRYPELVPKQAAIEGTAAHWVMREMLYNRPVALGAMTPENIPVDDAMLQGAEMYADEVRAAYASVQSVSHYEVEQTIPISNVHANNWGTPDTWLFGHNPGNVFAQLHLFDFKFGHDFVEVFECWQLVDYLAGILEKLGIDAHGAQYVEVTFHIVQPRSYHRDGPVRTWKFIASDAYRLINRLWGAAKAAHAPNPAANPDPAACTYCPGRHACEALQREGYKLAEMSGMSTPLEMSQPAMGLELRTLERYIDLAKARASGLAEQIEYGLASGQSNPFYHMAPGQSKLAWTKADSEIIALGQLLGVDLAKPPAAITPTQAKSKMDPALLQMYSELPRAALKLTPVSTVAARKVFGKGGTV